jgi:cytochrome c oxidase assembly protein subunit 15
MVDWRPQGRALPSSDEDWQAEFEKYKAFPEFQMVNRHIGMEEFKNIYFVEWFHRMWGRGIGMVFLLPAAYFAARGMIPSRVRGKVAAAGALGAFQGGVGWWMVKSGLTSKKDGKAQHEVPRVSPYRLATHLGVAFTTYSILTWAAMDLLAKPGAALGASSTRAVRALKPLGLAAAAVAGITAASGAFVAGNDAGRAYNDWPLMAGQFVPEEIWDETLGMKNIFENTATVQFDHRILAYSTLATVGALTVAARRPGMWNLLPQRARSAVNAMGVTVLGQVGLGITTLMMYVPIGLGTAHQGGALLLWSTALWLMHALRRHSTKHAATQVTTAGARAALAAPLFMTPAAVYAHAAASRLEAQVEE